MEKKVLNIGFYVLLLVLILLHVFKTEKIVITLSICIGMISIFLIIFSLYLMKKYAIAWKIILRKENLWYILGSLFTLTFFFLYEEITKSYQYLSLSFIAICLLFTNNVVKELPKNKPKIDFFDNENILDTEEYRTPD